MRNDASRSRIQALRLALERWGAVNTASPVSRENFFGAWYPGVFDKVLIDAPCSMEGLRTAESHPMRPVTGRERESLSAAGAPVAGALKAVRVGGQVVYSTCTLAPEEDEAVLLAIKRRYGSAVEILMPRLAMDAPACKSGIQRLSDITARAAHLAVLFNSAGFFTALIRKNVAFEEGSGNRPAQHS